MELTDAVAGENGNLETAVSGVGGVRVRLGHFVTLGGCWMMDDSRLMRVKYVSTSKWEVVFGFRVRPLWPINSQLGGTRPEMSW